MVQTYKTKFVSAKNVEVAVCHQNVQTYICKTKLDRANKKLLSECWHKPSFC